MIEFSISALVQASLEDCECVWAALVDELAFLSEKESKYAALVVPVEVALMQEAVKPPSSLTIGRRMIEQYGGDVVTEHKKRWYRMTILKAQIALVKYLVYKKSVVVTGVPSTPIE